MYQCPYFSSLKKRELQCEMAELNFPDEAAMRGFLQKFCSHHPGWRQCAIAKAMNEYYERRDNREKYR